MPRVAKTLAGPTAQTHQAIRLAARKSREWVAVHAGVSSATVRLFEASPAAVHDEHKRRAIENVYHALAKETGE